MKKRGKADIEKVGRELRKEEEELKRAEHPYLYLIWDIVKFIGSVLLWIFVVAGLMWLLESFGFSTGQSLAVLFIILIVWSLASESKRKKK